ncbi:MAG: TlyA family RNA methyltransferase [Campylobacterota bacterium]|nr:TlyA family RNA methyltransferase [Campylobacterota bacterium]
MINLRLDQYLVEHNGIFSRNKAQELIKAKKVSVDGKVIVKPAFKVADECVEVDQTDIYVSRAAWKLKGFLPELPFDVQGMEVVDIGASTGGFTQVLLEKGAEHVYAVDVGSDQLHPTLRKDSRITSIENTDIRDYDPERTFELLVSDVSFISLLNILDDVDRLAEKWIILLFKPQFEVGREVKRDKHGVVQDKKAIEKAKMRFEDAASLLNWELIAMETSKLSGKEGNSEFCYCFRKD